MHKKIIQSSDYIFDCNYFTAKGSTWCDELVSDDSGQYFTFIFTFEPNLLIYKYAMPKANDFEQYEHLQANVPGLLQPETEHNVELQIVESTHKEVVIQESTTRGATTKKQLVKSVEIIEPVELDPSITRADLVQEKGIIMGKPTGDIDFDMIKRLFEINELIFRIDQPDRLIPPQLRSWRHVKAVLWV